MAKNCAVSIDHRAWSTHYAHMSRMIVTPSLGRLRRRQYVRAGEVIGNAARSPLYIRFELHAWRRSRLRRDRSSRRGCS